MTDTPLAGMHILVAEDNTTNQMVIRKMIERLGGTAQICHDGAEAIRAFDPQKFTLALLDIEMPKKSGIEVIQYIRARPDSDANFPIIVLSAFVLNEHKAKVFKAGADEIIAKPIMDIAEFGAVLSKYLTPVSQKHTPSHKFPQEWNRDKIENLRADLGDEFYEKFIQSLKSDLQNMSGELKAAQDFAAQKAAAHKLIPLFDMINAQDLVSLCREIEQGEEDDAKFHRLQIGLELSLAWLEQLSD